MDTDSFSVAAALLPEYLGQHVLLSMSAIALGATVSLPLGIACARSRAFRGPILGAAGALQTIPGLALLALFYPILLALSSVTERAFGWRIPALGFVSTIIPVFARRPMFGHDAVVMSLIATGFLAFGLCFEIPVVLLILVLVGVVTPAQLAESRRYAIVGAFVVAAFLTPPDAVSMLMLAIPMCVLYELGIIGARVLTRSQHEERPDASGT